MERELGKLPDETRNTMNSEICFRVVGIPGAQGSKMLTRYGAMIESSKKVKPWRQDIRHAALEFFKQDPIDCAVSLSIEFVFSRPKSHFGTGKNANIFKPSAPKLLTSHSVGDIDKLCRSTLDGLSVTTGGTVIKDDCLVVSLHAEKRYAKRGELPGATISIMPILLT